MKRTIIVGVVVSAIGLVNPRTVQAQGTITFLSNLGQTPIGVNAVGSDSWLAADFGTGNNAGGYVLTSVQMGLADASGNPGGFTVMVYSEANNPGAVLPGSSLGTLTGASDPTVAGDYTYTPVSSLTLLPNKDYFIVVTAGTAVANGAYGWNFLNTSAYQPADGWIASVTYSSGNGTSWTRLGSSPNFDFSEFALNATATPEPGVIGLFALGGLLIASQRRKASLVE
jgi:hypothetical protein